MLLSVGSRAAMFSGVLSATIGLEIMKRGSANEDCGSEDTTKSVPPAMYTSLNSVHPGACEMTVVSGRAPISSTGAGVGATGIGEGVAMTLISRVTVTGCGV